MKGATTNSRSKTSKTTGSKRGPGRPRGSTNKKTSTSSRSSTTRRSPANSRGGRARFGTFVNATDGMPTKADPMGKAVVRDDPHTNTGSCSLVYGDCVGDDAQVEGELKALRNETSSSRRKNFDQQHNKTHNNNNNNHTTHTASSSSSQLSGLHSKDINGHYTSPRMDHSKKFHTLRSPAQLLMTSRLVVPFSKQQKNFSSVNFIIQDDVSARGMGSNAASSSTASQQKQQQQQQHQQQPKTMSSGNQHRENQQEQQQQYHKTGAGTTGTTRGSTTTTTAAHAEKPTQRHDTRQNPFFNKTSTTSSHMKHTQDAVGGQQNQSRGFSTRVAIKAFMKRHFTTQTGPVQQQQHHDKYPQQQQQSRRDGDNKKNTTTTTASSTTSSPSARNEKLHNKVDATLNNQRGGDRKNERKSVDVSEEKF